MSSVISELSTKKVRSSVFDTCHGKLPIQIPCSDLFSTSDFLVCLISGSGLGSAPDLDGGRGLPFLRRRRAFLEGGSGAVMSTSISSTTVFRFFEGGVSEFSALGVTSGEVAGTRLLSGSATDGGFSVSITSGSASVRASTFLFLLDLSFFDLVDAGGAVVEDSGVLDGTVVS